MTNTELLAKIKAEIERNRDKNWKGENLYYDVNDIKNAGICRHRKYLCEELLSFISILESEKLMNLEEEINRYLREECSNDDEPSISEVARYFAKWGAEHLADARKTLEIKPGDEVTINGHKIVYDKDKGYVTIAKSEESVPNDLEEAAWDCVLDSVDVNNPVLLPKYKELLTYLFIAGAKWQAEQDQETIELAEDHAYLAGAVNEREKMMKGAVEGEVSAVILHENGDEVHYAVTYPVGERPHSITDKVRIIIVKED